jgi:hypothetical protein
VPELRNPAIRKKVKPRLRDATSPEDKLRIIRALYIMVFNSDESLIPLTTELFHTLGEILEGIEPDSLSLNRIDKRTLIQTIEALY